MNNNITELVFILDKSGSMAGLEGDTIGGFNSMIEKQKAQEGECYVSTILFDTCSKVLHDRVKLADVPKMTEEDYVVGGCTALIDAVGGAIKHICSVHKYIRTEDVPTNTIFVITTDGMENASRIFSSAQVKEMIEQQKKNGWEFLFIGANIDAVETAAHFGIGRNRAVNYHADGQGTRVLYECVSDAAIKVRQCQKILDTWSKDIEEDYQQRDSKKK